jgi:hypothetical protein
MVEKAKFNDQTKDPAQDARSECKKTMTPTELSDAILIELAKAARRIGEDYPDIYDELLAELMAAHSRWLERIGVR